MCSQRNLSNCWEILKLILLQHKDETSLSVNVAKAERKYKMRYGQILSLENGQSAAKLQTEEKVQRLSQEWK